MADTRTYTARDIRWIVELMRNQPEISPEKFSGMEYIAAICEHFQDKTEADIEEMVRQYYSHA